MVEQVCNVHSRTIIGNGTYYNVCEHCTAFPNGCDCCNFQVNNCPHDFQPVASTTDATLFQCILCGAYVRDNSSVLINIKGV